MHGHCPEYGIKHIDADCLRAYRNRFNSTRGDHPYSSCDDIEFLRYVGDGLKNQTTGEEGLTLAGLLMFGNHVSINLELPKYFVDFRECECTDYQIEWSHRLVPDGTWSGNIYDFYRKVIQYLFRDLKVPFKLEQDQRIDETPIHKALRESLVNTLIHADYSDRLPVLVVKAAGFFYFRNPGLMRVPVNDAMRGGNSDCRNGNLQRMFSLIGLGEQAGSGVRRVISHWESQHYRLPELTENPVLSVTELTLRTISLLPTETLQRLAENFGEKFQHLDEHDRVILATADIEAVVSNVRVQQLCDLHPRDITSRLQGLVAGGWLVSSGRARATTYRLMVSAGDPCLSADDPGCSANDPGRGVFDPGSNVADPGSGAEDPGSGAKDAGSAELALTGSAWAGLWNRAAPVREARRSRAKDVQAVVLSLCEGQFLSIAQLAELLGRDSRNLRKRIIATLVQGNLLERRFPDQPSHERQAYRSTAAGMRFMRGSDD